MSSFKLTLIGIALLTGTTIGAGIFALPYLFSVTGIAIGIVYIVVLSAIVVATHLLYYQVLQHVAPTEGKHRLLGLVQLHLGRRPARFGFIVIILGLLLTLVAYLSLASSFLQAIFPDLAGGTALSIVWVVCSLPLVLGARRFVGSEFVGTVLMIALIGVIVLLAPQVRDVTDFRLVSLGDLALPFGPVLFALAGWTAIEPIFEWRTKHPKARMYALSVLGFGTGGVAILYILFSIGMLGAAPQITADTISGLQGWPIQLIGLMMLLGVFAIWTSYVPMSREVTTALYNDIHWPKSLAFLVVIFMPYLLVVSGLNNFLIIAALVGGVFLASQYILILLLARKVLAPRGARRAVLDISLVVFIVAALYEIYYLIHS